MSTLMEALASWVSGEAAVNTAPKEQKQIALGSAVELVRLINGKAVDMATSLPTMAGGQITFGEILASRTEGVTRRNNTVGADYVRVHELSHEVASSAIENLKKLPPKAASNFQPKAGKKSANSPKANPAPADAEGMIKALIASALAEILEPAKPVVAQGHEVTPEPAKPVVEEVNVVDLAPGTIVRINGELRQVSTDGKRLNKSIA